ncbi:YcaO-like family protein [Enterococcus sp. DIV1420a]|uniref:YcaO-like family protein n=1 Tax=Enterococcus sp. DIV1420a TaxID=2774672 RepID=UPI003F2817D8
MNNYLIKNNDEVNYFLNNNVYTFSFNDFLNDATNTHSDFPLLEGGNITFENFIEIIKPSTFYIKVLNVGRLIKNLNEVGKRDDIEQIVIEFFDCIVYVSDLTNFCSKCFFKRYQEGMDSTYTKYIELENDYEVNFVSTSIEKVMNEDEKKSFIVWDKNLSQYYDSPCLCYPDCKNKSNIILKNTDVSKLIGRFSPVRNVCYQGDIDIVHKYVYGANSSAPANEKFLDEHGGKGFTKVQAFYSAVYESLERYSARQFGYEKVIRDSYDNLIRKGCRVLNPDRLSLDSSKENKNRYEPNKVYEWIEGIDLSNKKKILMPANIVYFPYVADKKYYFSSYSTTGLSANTSIDNAILQGLLEVIERNSYALTHKAQLHVVDLKNDIDNFAKNLEKKLNKCRIKANFTLLSNSFGTYVVHCTLEDLRNNFPIYTHGAGASLNIEKAMLRAITESVQLRTSQLLLKEYEVINEEVNIANKEWAVGNKQYVEPFLNSKINKQKKASSYINLESNNIKTDIEKIRNNLSLCGHDIFYVNLTRKDILVPAVKVIVPGLQDIDNSNKENSETLTKLGIKNFLPMFS